MGILLGIFNLLFSLLSGGANMALGLVKQAFGGIMQYHQMGIDFARSMGMSFKQAQAYTDVLTTRATDLAFRYGIAADAVKELQVNLAQASGKALMLNDEDAEKFVQINKLVGSNVAAQFTSEITTHLGGQLSSVTGAVSKAYATAAKSGLNAAQFSEKVAKNLSLANKLSFRNGVNGIIKMTALSEKLGFNLQSVERAAENFMDIDKAIEHSAQLQMLGGAAGAYGSNPLLMSYEANYDPEAFTERMTKTLGGYATFDANTGMANVNGMNRDFVKNIAQAMGISMDEAMSIAKKQSEVAYKEAHFGNEVRNRGYSKEQEDYIINSSYIGADGKLKMTDLQGREQDVDTLVKNGDLDKMMSLEGKSDEEIMRTQAATLTSINEKIEGLQTSALANMAASINEKLPNIYQMLEKFGPEIIDMAGELGTKIAKVVEEAIGFINQNADTIIGALGKIADAVGFILDHWVWFAAIYAGTKILGMLGRGLNLFRRGGRLLRRGGRLERRGARAARGGRIGRGVRSVGRGLRNGGRAAVRGLGRGGRALGRGVVSGGRALGRGVSSGARGLRNVVTRKARNTGNAIRGGGNIGAYSRYARSNYKALRASGAGRVKSLRLATRGPKVVTGANGTKNIVNSATGKIMGRVGSQGAKSLEATRALRGAKFVKGAGAFAIATSALGAGMEMNNFKDTKKDLDAQLASGQITQQEYNDTMKEASNNKNEAIGESVGAIAGGAIGSLLGPIGTAAGAWLGSEVGGFIGKHWQETTDFIKDTWNGPVRDFAEGVFGQAGAGIVDGVGDIVGGVANGVGDVLGGAASAVGDVAKGVWDGIGEVGTGVVDGFGQMLEGDIGGGLLTMGEGLFNGIGTVAEGVWHGVEDLAVGVWDGISSVATGVWDGVSDIASGVWGTISDGWNGFTNQVSTAWGAITDGVGAAWDWTTTAVSDAWNGVTSFVTDAWNGSIDTVTSVATSMWDGIGSLASNIFGGLGDLLGGIGSAIGDAWDWTTGAIGDAADWVAGAASDAWDFVTSGFGLFSKGGVVSGNQTEGDRVLARVNSGEMILNPDQQAKLFGLIDGLPGSLINGLFGNDIMSSFSSAVSGVWDGISSLFGGVGETLTSNASGLWDTISGLFGGITDAFSSTASGVFDVIGNTASGVFDGITSLFGFGSVVPDTYNPDDFSSPLIDSIFGKSSAEPTKTIGETLASINDSITSVLTNKNDVEAKPIGEREYIYEPRGTEVSNVGGNNITVNDFNVKINGTIRLEGGNSFKNIDVSQLLSDHQFVSSLKEIIKSSMNNDVNGGRFMNDSAQMRGLPAQTSLWGRKG